MRAIREPDVAAANGAGAGTAYRELLRRPLALYAIVLALVVLTVLACWLVAPGLGGLSLYLFLLPAVLTAGLFGGLGPGLFATALGLAAQLFADTGLADPSSSRFGAGLAGAVTFAALGVGDRLARRTAAPGSRAGANQRACRACPRGASAVDPGHRPGRHGGHRRTRHHAVVQRRRRAPVRLPAERGDRQERQHADAVALSREITTAISNATCAPASGGSSASAVSSSASARTARPFRWNCRSAK